MRHRLMTAREAARRIHPLHGGRRLLGRQPVGPKVRNSLPRNRFHVRRQDPMREANTGGAEAAVAVEDEHASVERVVRPQRVRGHGRRIPAMAAATPRGSRGTVLVGISAWTEPTLIKAGGFYPKKTMSAEERLRFYASQFPVAEVDSTY